MFVWENKNKLNYIKYIRKNKYLFLLQLKYELNFIKMDTNIQIHSMINNDFQAVAAKSIFYIKMRLEKLHTRSQKHTPKSFIKISN